MLHAVRWRSARLFTTIATSLALAGCPAGGDQASSGPGASGTTGRGPAPTSRTTGATAPRTPEGVAPGSRAALRDSSAPGPFVGGFALEIRGLVSRVTTVDPLGVALRLLPETPGKNTPSSQLQLDGARALSTLRVEVKTPSATHTLQPAEVAGRPESWPVSMFVKALAIDGAGIGRGAIRRPWKNPVPGLLSTPGTYVVTLAGSFDLGGQTLELRSGPLTFTVAPANGPQRALVDLERAASEVARATWGTTAIPIPSDPTVDDVDGNLSVRFRRSGADPGGTGYDDHILEVWLDPAGKTLAVDAYRHFTCVAEGTLVATPHGPTPIEALAVGTEVDAFDVVTRTRSVAVVLRVDRSHSEALRQIGGLRVTAEHPLWAGGAWVPAGEVAEGATLLGVDLRPVVATPVVLDAAATVYDLTVSPPSTFFAGGVLVHNKAVHVPLGGDRPWGPMFFRRAAKP